MVERELCPLCGVPLEDEAGPVLEGECPVHGVIGRLKGVDDFAPPGLLGQEAEDGLSVWPGTFGDTLPVGTAGWRRVDGFEVGDGGPDAHGFEIVEELDSFRSSQKLRYPDGTTVEAHGMAHEGGRARWTLEGLSPGHDALLIIQTDVMYAGGDLRLEAGDGAVVFPDFAPDRRYRARNRVVPIPGRWIGSETLAVALGRLESTKDLSHFAVWVYQSRTPDPDLYADEEPEAPSVDIEPPAPAPHIGDITEHAAEPDVAQPDTVEPVDDEPSMPAPLLAPPPSVDALLDGIPPNDDDDKLETVDVPAAALADEPDEPAESMAAADASKDGDISVDVPAPATPEPDDVPTPDAAIAEPEPETPMVEAEPAVNASPAGPAALDETPLPDVPADDEPADDVVLDEPVNRAPAVSSKVDVAPPEAPEPTPAPIAAAPQAAPAAREQKLVTITLADADHAHGTGHAHLASELRAGWRIAKLECLPGPRGGWLVVLLER